MKFLIVLALIVACVSAGRIQFDSDWVLFKNKHSKIYADEDEESLRRAIWESNMQKINKHNKEAINGVHRYTLKMNHFGDLTSQEFTSFYNGFNKTGGLHKTPGHTFRQPLNFKAPDSVDWRTSGYVTPVKNQEQCGSCWAFSAVASLEGQNFRKTGQLVSLSEQNLVDCSKSYGNNGCGGGLMDQAFSYIKNNSGIDTEESYPYQAVDQKCQYDPTSVGATVTGFVDIPAQDEDALTAALATVGPISIAIDASHQSFQFYHTGVYNEKKCSSTRLDHGVTAVGYGTEADGDYFIVKNSWGEGWGQSGYIYMARNENNKCGIASCASYPLV